MVDNVNIDLNLSRTHHQLIMEIRSCIEFPTAVTYIGPWNRQVYDAYSNVFEQLKVLEQVKSVGPAMAGLALTPQPGMAATKKHMTSP